MTNFLTETDRVLSRNHKTWDDVRWVGTREIELDIDAFKDVASGIDYDSGYGIQEIVDDIVIVGDNWYLERQAYDGAERWRYITIPTRPMQDYTGKDFTLRSPYGTDDFANVNKDILST